MYDTMPNVSLLTLPRSGTQFTIKFLNNLGMNDYYLGGNNTYFHTHPKDTIIKEELNILVSTPVIITKRNPLYSILSQVHMGIVDKDSCVETFQTYCEYFFKLLSRLSKDKCYILNIDCPVNLRERHLLKCIEFFDTDLANKETDTIKKYAKQWMPIDPSPKRIITKEDINLIEKKSKQLIPEIYDWYNSSY